MSYTPKRERLRTAYMHIVKNWAVGTNDIADHFYNGEIAAARRDLLELEASGLIEGTDVNGEAQGSARSGTYKSLTWQSYFDVENEEDVEERAGAAFNQEYPPTKEDEVSQETQAPEAEAPTEAKAETAKPEQNGSKPAAEKKAAQPKLTNSQRVRLVELAGGVQSPQGQLAVQPFDYFVEVGYATKSGTGEKAKYKITAAGEKRAGTIDVEKYRRTKK